MKYKLNYWVCAALIYAKCLENVGLNCFKYAPYSTNKINLWCPKCAGFVTFLHVFRGRVHVRVLSWTYWSVCSSGMWSPAVLWRGGARLLPTGRPHLVQELQRSPHPGPLSQNLHWLLTNHLFSPLTLKNPRTRNMLHIFAGTDGKWPCSVQSRATFSFFFFFFAWLLWVDINITIVPSVGIQLQFPLQRNIFCYWFKLQMKVWWSNHITSFLSFTCPHTFSFFWCTANAFLMLSSVFSGLTCRQLGLYLPFIHTGTAQLLACTWLALSKTMKVWKEIVDLDLKRRQRSGINDN